jgi:hypothetical protein
MTFELALIFFKAYFAFQFLWRSVIKWFQASYNKLEVKTLHRILWLEKNYEENMRDIEVETGGSFENRYSRNNALG